MGFVLFIFLLNARSMHDVACEFACAETMSAKVLKCAKWYLNFLSVTVFWTKTSSVTTSAV